MIRRHANTATQVAALLGLSVSAFLLVQYMLPPPTGGGCPLGGGCHVVRTCRMGEIPSSTWPPLGVLGFLVALPLTLATAGWARALLRIAATLGGVVGLGLLVAQKAVCGAFCPYCLLTDLSALVLAAGAWMGRGQPLAISGWRRAAFAVLALGAFGGSAAWLIHGGNAEAEPTHLAELPPQIAGEQRPGAVTVVEFMDFTCPHCRAQAPELKQALAPFAGRVHLVRKYGAFGEEGRNAARAARCAEAQGKGDALADLLIETEDFSPAACEALAVKAGVDAAAYRACVAAPETDASVSQDRVTGDALRLLTIPTIYVGHDRYDGNVPAPILKASIEAELRASGVDPGARPLSPDRAKE